MNHTLSLHSSYTNQGYIFWNWSDFTFFYRVILKILFFKKKCSLVSQSLHCQKLPEVSKRPVSTKRAEKFLAKGWFPLPTRKFSRFTKIFIIWYGTWSSGSKPVSRRKQCHITRKVEGIRGEFQNLNAYRRKNIRPIWTRLSRSAEKCSGENQWGFPWPRSNPQHFRHIQV